MKRITTQIVMLALMLFSLPGMAQVDELKGKIVSLSTAATEIEAGKWYVMKNGGRSAYAYSQGLGEAMLCSSISSTNLTGADAEEVAGYLVRFAAVDGVESAYTIQSGLGDYWSELTNGSNSGTVESDPMYFTSGKIGDNADWFWFVGNNGEMVLDCNAVGGTVAGWGTDLPTGTSSNAAWQIMSIEFIDASSVITSYITYNYKIGEEVVYTYTKKVLGADASLTVVFDAPGTYLGAVTTDTAPADETITESKDFTVTYTYTIDAEALPFTPTTISGEKFADDTKWYFLQPSSRMNYAQSIDDAEEVAYGNIDNADTDLRSFFTFTGNPIGGFKIYNYKKGTTMPFQADDSYYSTSIYLVENEGSDFVLEEGTSEGQFRLRYKTNPDAYVNAYSGYIGLYTWSGGWASEDSGSQYYITEVSDSLVDIALKGRLEDINISHENGYVFRNGETLSQIMIQYSENIDFTDADVTVTLLDDKGNLVASPLCTIDEQEKDILTITFDPAISAEGNYTLNIPAGLVAGIESGLANFQKTLKYSVLPGFEARTLVARVWKTKTVNGYNYSNWPTLPYLEGKDYYKVTIQVDDKDKVTLLDWEGTGNEGNDLSFTWDITQTSYNGLSVNGESIKTEDSYIWVDTKKVVDDGYYGFYCYPGYSNFSMDEKYGQLQLYCYSYASDGAYYVIADWYMDNRYGKDIVKGTVCNKTVSDELEGEEAWTQLPYGEDGTYDVEIIIDSDSTVIIKDYTGVEGEDKTIQFDPETGDVLTIDGQEADSYGTVWCASTVLDGSSYNGYYEFTGSYSHVEYDKETGKGLIWLLGLDYSTNDEGDYRYIFITISGEAATEPADTTVVIPTENYTARVLKSAVVDGETYTNWTSLPYPEGEDYYEVQVVKEGDSKLIVKDWDGKSGDNLTICYDATGTVTSIAESNLTDGYYWMDTTLDIDNYPSSPGCYVYPSNSTVNIGSDGGRILIYCYSYTIDDYPCIIIEWGTAPDAVNAVSIDKAQSARTIYNLNGQRIAVPTKGLYIIGGRKMMIK